MKRKLQFVASASAASLLAFSALAQSHSEQLNGAARATDIIGMTVDNPQSQKLGTVQDLIVDVESGRLVQMNISSGGFFGMGRILTPVPPEALDHVAGGKVLYLDVSKQKFAAAPRFDASKWDEGTQSNRLIEIYGYYGEQPFFVADPDGYRNASQDGTVAATLPRHMDGSINTDGARTMDKADNVETARNLEATSNWISTRNPDGTWTRDYYSNGTRSAHAWSRLGYIQTLGKLRGMPVRNRQEEKLGKVENLVVDISRGRIVAVIISSGGFIGMNGELSAVPPTALSFNPEHDALQLDASKEMLANSPHFKANQWPDFGQVGYAGGVYRAYNVAPYFNIAPAAEPDNTARNVRDRNNATLTPLDQGNSPADLTTTAQIRQEIIADESMSTNAKNVKIITIDGHVTLRGPVSSDAERRLIGEIADRIAQAGNVDNQLEVQITTSLN